MRTIPQLKKKRRVGIDPDSLVAALCWDKIADPGVPSDGVVDGARPVVRGDGMEKSDPVAGKEAKECLHK